MKKPNPTNWLRTIRLDPSYRILIFAGLVIAGGTLPGASGFIEISLCFVPLLGIMVAYPTVMFFTRRKM